MIHFVDIGNSVAHRQQERCPESSLMLPAGITPCANSCKNSVFS
jgi:hypothetical protein